MAWVGTIQAMIRNYFPNWIGMARGCHKSELDSYTYPQMHDGLDVGEYDGWLEAHKNIPCDPNIQPKGRLDVLHYNTRATYRQAGGSHNYGYGHNVQTQSVNVQWQGTVRGNGGQYLVPGHGCKAVSFDVDSNGPKISLFEKDLATGEEDPDNLWTIFDLQNFKYHNYAIEGTGQPAGTISSDYFNWGSSRDADWADDIFTQWISDGFYTMTQWGISRPQNGRFILHGVIATENQNPEAIHYYVEIRSMEDGSVLSSGLVSEATTTIYGATDTYFTPSYYWNYHGAHSLDIDAFIPVSDTEFVYRNINDNSPVNNPEPKRMFARYQLVSTTYTLVTIGDDEIISHVYGDDDYIYALAYTPNNDENLDGWFGWFFGFWQPIITNIRLIKIDPSDLSSTIINNSESSRLLRFMRNTDYEVPLVYHQSKLYASIYTSWCRYDLDTNEEFVFSVIAAGGYDVSSDYKYYNDPDYSYSGHVGVWPFETPWYMRYWSTSQPVPLPKWFDYPRNILLDTFDGGTDLTLEDYAEYAECEEPESCVTCSSMRCLDGKPCFCYDGASGICTDGVCDCCEPGEPCQTCWCPGGLEGVCGPEGCDCSNDGGCKACGSDYDTCACLDGCTGHCWNGRCLDCCAEPGFCMTQDGKPIAEGQPCKCDEDPWEGPYTGICKNGNCVGCGQNNPWCTCDKPGMTGKPCTCKDGIPGECLANKCVNRKGKDCCCPDCEGGGGTPRCRDREGMPCECRDGTPGTCSNGKCIDENGEDCCPGCRDEGDPGDCSNKAEGEGCTCADGSPGECVNGECLDPNGDECCPGCGGGDGPWCDTCKASCNGGIGNEPDGEPCTCCDGSTSECLNGECDCPCTEDTEGDACTTPEGCDGICTNGCCKTDDPCNCLPTATTNAQVADGGPYCAEHSLADCPFLDGRETRPVGFLSYACHLACSAECEDKANKSPEMFLTVSGDCEFCSGPVAEKLDDGEVTARTYIGACLNCIANVSILGCYTLTVTTGCYGEGSDCVIEDEFQYGGDCL